MTPLILLIVEALPEYPLYSTSELLLLLRFSSGAGKHKVVYSKGYRFTGDFGYEVFTVLVLRRTAIKINIKCRGLAIAWGGLSVFSKIKST